MDQHLAELSSMYEYIQVSLCAYFSSILHFMLTMSRQSQNIKASQPVIQSKVASAPTSSGVNRLPTGPRTVRGGQSNVMEGAVATPPPPPSGAAQPQAQDAQSSQGTQGVSGSGGFSAVKALGLTSSSFGGSSKSLAATAVSGSQQVDLGAVEPRPESSPRKSSGAKLLAMFLPSKKS